MSPSSPALPQEERRFRKLFEPFQQSHTITNKYDGRLRELKVLLARLNLAARDQGRLLPDPDLV